MLTQSDIKKEFIEMYKNKQFNLEGMLELIGATFIVEGGSVFGSINEDYAKREHDWYLSQSLNVNDIEGEVPTIWKNIADVQGFINSNYGYLALSEENGNQFAHAVHNLAQNKNSRQSLMVYTRPSIHEDAFKNNRKDFICTNTQHLIIRNNKLNMIVNQRSSDLIFGFRYDMMWAKHLQETAVSTLKLAYPELEIGDLILQTGSLHVYPRHFKLIEKEL